MIKNPKIWKLIAYKTGVWLAAEIWLNLIGLDNIADYSEFIFTQNIDLNKNKRTVKITEYPPHFCFKIHDFCPIPGTTSKLKDLEEDRCSTKAKVFKHKCQRLAEPCLKIKFLTTTITIETGI